MNKEFNVKEFIRNALELQPELKSKDLVIFLKNKGYDVTWQMIAGIKGTVK